MSNQQKIEEQINDLEHRATRLHSHIHLASRAFVVEFAGTPKSGKSTSVEAIRHFFKRFGFGVHVLSERAAQCPIPMKGHLFFNTWCATTMLAELIENVDTRTDIIIADRGLFDALIWFQTQAKRGELLPEEMENIENFLLMDRWKNLFDLVVVLRAKAETALKRENAHRITARPGSIMNTPMLESLSDAVGDAVNQYQDKFKNVIVEDTDEGDERCTNLRLVGEILDRFEAFVDPDILVVPKHKLKGLLADTPNAFVPKAEVEQMQSIIETNGEYRKRTEVESNAGFIQIVPCGALLHQGQVFVFQRNNESPKSRLYGKTTIWQGCHVVRPTDGKRSISTILQALQSRIAQSLFISRQLSNKFVGYTWDASNSGDGKHLGLIFRMDIESPELAESLKEKEFRRTRGHSLDGGFRNIEDLRSSIQELGLEPWSKQIINECGEISG